jgi:hemoglobin-like flavoprotein
MLAIEKTGASRDTVPTPRTSRRIAAVLGRSAEVVQPMTPAQKQLVQASFARLAPSADAVGEMFYRELFALDPGLRELFKSDIAQQGRNLMRMLSTAIANLDRLESIAPAVRDLGRRHAGYGVEPADYQTGAHALIATLERGLGSDFTPALREAWASCYQALAGQMMAGAEERKGVPQPRPLLGLH